MNLAFIFQKLLNVKNVFNENSVLGCLKTYNIEALCGHAIMNAVGECILESVSQRLRSTLSSN